MSEADNYISGIILSKSAPPLNLSDYRLQYLIQTLKEWGGIYLTEIKLSGSSAKGTAIKGVADVDLFLSISSNLQSTLKEIYYSLDGYLKSKYIDTRKQNVSIGVTQSELRIDLVPAKLQSGYRNYHSLYLSKKDSWTQTNIDLHTSTVKDSGRQDEIKATKIWREINKLNFPSVYLELSVLEAVKYKIKNDLANNFWAVLNYLKDDFVEKTITDPANTNNKISDDIYKYEKEAISKAAEYSTKQQLWVNIIW